MLNRMMAMAMGLILTAPGLALAAEPPPAKVEATAPAWGKLLSSDRKLVYPLDKPEIIVGSDPACGVVLHDNSVSPQHLRIAYKDGLVEIEDLGSKTGTLVAGALLKKGKPFRIVQPVEVDVGAVTVYFQWGRAARAFAAHAEVGPSQEGGARQGRWTGGKAEQSQVVTTNCA